MTETDPGDLERRVKELEATVRGLTQELVEANERIRLLEREIEDEPPEANKPISPEDGPSEDEESTDDESDEVDDGPPEEDDIIVA